jgi:signal transduction histidine kinase
MSQQLRKHIEWRVVSCFAITIFAGCVNSSPKPAEARLNAAYDQAFEFRDNGKADSAYLYFSRAKDVFLGSHDSLGAGKCLLNMAMISSEKGDLYGGQELSLTAIAYFNEEDSAQHIYIQSNLNNLGIINYGLEAYDRAISFYEEAVLYTPTKETKLILQNNIANAYRRKGDYQKALGIYASVLKEKLSEADYARTLSNMAYTKWLQDSTYNPNAALEQGLKIREQLGNQQEQIASLNYLVGVNQQSRADVALEYAQRMHATARQINNPNDRLVALQKLVSLSSGAAVKNYFRSHQALNDSIQLARNAAKNQFALIRYESEKRKSENLKLQQINIQQAYKVAARELLILLGTLSFVASAIIAVLWYRKRQAKMHAEKQSAIQEHKLKTSRRVHDVVANGLYRVITEIDNDEALNKDDILDKLEVMYEKSRDISYDIPLVRSSTEDFNHKIDRLLKSFATTFTRIDVSGNTAAYWADIPEQISYELEHILQELMVNMKKHSRATRVSLEFTRLPDRACITYRDNGVGMNADQNHGNGLLNTGSRIQSIHGEINFETAQEGGLTIKLFFPVL